MQYKRSLLNLITQNQKFEQNFCLLILSSDIYKRKKKDFYKRFNNKQNAQ